MTRLVKTALPKKVQAPTACITQDVGRQASVKPSVPILPNNRFQCRIDLYARVAATTGRQGLVGYLELDLQQVQRMHAKRGNNACANSTYRLILSKYRRHVRSLRWMCSTYRLTIAALPVQAGSLDMHAVARQQK